MRLTILRAKFWIKHNRSYLAGVAIGLALSPAVVWYQASRSMWFGAISWADQHEGFAAWIQAAGVIFALIIAIAVPVLQENRATKRAQDSAAEAEQEQHRNLLVLVHSVLKLMNALPEWCLLVQHGKTAPSDTRVKQCATLSDLLSRIEIIGIRDYSMIVSLAEIRAGMDAISELLNRASELSRTTPLTVAGELLSGDMTECLERVRSIAPEVQKRCEEYIDLAREFRLRGGPPEPPDENEG